MRRQLSTKKLRKFMAARGWNEKHLAAFADLSPPAIEAILKGTSGGRATSLLKIADALGVTDLNELFDRLE